MHGRPLPLLARKFVSALVSFYLVLSTINRVQFGTHLLSSMCCQVTNVSNVVPQMEIDMRVSKAAIHKLRRVDRDPHQHIFQFH